MILMDTDAEQHSITLQLKHGMMAMVEFAIATEMAAPSVSHSMLQYVALLLTIELSVDICSDVFAALKGKHALEVLLQNLPIALAAGRVRQKDESKTYPFFEVTDRVK